MNEKKIENSLFNELDTLIEANDENKINEFIEKNKSELLKLDPIRFIGSHIDFYIFNGEFNKALEILNQYQNAPFISLKVDEFMKDLENQIKSLAKPKTNKQYDVNNLEKDLKSSNEDKLFQAFMYLYNANIRTILPIIRKLLLSDIKYEYKALIEFILIEQHVNEQFEITYDEGKFSFCPDKSILPFEKEKFIKAVDYISKLNESPSIISASLDSLKKYETISYPFSFLDLIDYPVACEIVIFVVKKYMNENPSFNELIKNTLLSEDELNELILKFEKAINR